MLHFHYAVRFPEGILFGEMRRRHDCREVPEHVSLSIAPRWMVEGQSCHDRELREKMTVPPQCSAT